MPRNFIRKIQDDFRYNHSLYNEFVKRYGFTLPKFLFNYNYYDIILQNIVSIGNYNEDNEKHKLLMIFSRFKGFTEDEILYFLENVNKNSEILNSPNYKFWCNPKFVDTFIDDYNISSKIYIDKICELNMVDVFDKFKSVFSCQDFLKFIENFNLDKDILMKLKIDDVASHYFPNLISLYKRQLPNEKEIIELYKKDNAFRKKFNYYVNNNKDMLFIVLENCTDLSNIKKVINYLDILDFYLKRIVLIGIYNLLSKAF